jgi:hypothetical protein
MEDRKPQTHRLKTWPVFFRDVIDGKKDFELRKDDRDFRVGDWILLEEFDPIREQYTGRVLTKRIKHVVRDVPRFGLLEGYAILGF